MNNVPLSALLLGTLSIAPLGACDSSDDGGASSTDVLTDADASPEGQRDAPAGDAPAAKQCDGAAPEPEPWETGEDEWTCSQMWGDCEEGFSPCACVDCCPAAWYAPDAPGTPGTAFGYEPELPGVLVTILDDGVGVPDTFQGTWDGVEAPTASSPDGTESVLVLGRDGEEDVRIATSIPLADLEHLAPAGTVTVHLDRDEDPETGGGLGVEIVDDASGDLLLAAWSRGLWGSSTLSRDLAGDGSWSVRVEEPYCKTLPDTCNLVLDVLGLELDAGGETHVVEPTETVELQLDGAPYTVHHAKGVRSGISPRGASSCAIGRSSGFHFWLVRGSE